MAMHSLKGPGGVELVSIFGNDSINHPETLPEHQAKASQTNAGRIHTSYTHINKRTDYDIHHPSLLICHCKRFLSKVPNLGLSKNSPDHLPQKSIDYNPDTIPPSLSQPPCKKNLKCPFPGCNKIFTQSYNVKPHYRLHFNVRPYNCDTCIATFARPRDLSRHVKAIHEKTREFTCSVCLDVFGRLDSLQRHTKLHAR